MNHRARFPSVSLATEFHFPATLAVAFSLAVAGAATSAPTGLPPRAAFVACSSDISASDDTCGSALLQPHPSRLAVLPLLATGANAEQLHDPAPTIKTLAAGEPAKMINVDVEGDVRYLENEAMLHLDGVVLVSALLVTALVQYFLSLVLGATMKSHLIEFGAWVACAAFINIYTWARHGATVADMWLAGYVLEWLLSMDNLFIFLAIFQCFGTPARERDVALSIGILFAAVLRMALFMGSVAVLRSCTRLQALFGVILVCSGIHGALDGDDDFGDRGEASPLVQRVKGLCGPRLTDEYIQGQFFTRDVDGRLCMTMLGPVVFVIGATDAVFAFDSVESKLGLINNPFVAFSSTVVCMFALKSLFFVLEALVALLAYVKYGIALILVFIGTEMVLKNFIAVPLEVMLTMIAVVFSASIVASFLFPPPQVEA